MVQFEAEMSDELHVYARAKVDELRAGGADLRKKMLRFNDIVAVGQHYSRCGIVPSLAVAKAGVLEAILACEADTVAASDLPVAAMIQPWMEAVRV